MDSSSERVYASIGNVDDGQDLLLVIGIRALALAHVKMSKSFLELC